MWCLNTSLYIYCLFVTTGCWYGIGTYTEGDNPNRMSTHTVADRNECYLLCEAQPSCLAVKSAKSNTECSLFSTKTWAYGYVLDSVVILVRNHCRPWINLSVKALYRRLSILYLLKNKIIIVVSLKIKYCCLFVRLFCWLDVCYLEYIFSSVTREKANAIQC